LPGLLSLIGRTPVVELGRLATSAPRAQVVAKLECRNPGGSVKDRIAVAMILDARERGALAAGGSIVEATAGNTGIGLALVGRALGHEVVLVMPARYSAEKRRLCRALGARVVELQGDAVGMPECREEARRIARTEGAVLVDQFANEANPRAHEETTGPELWEQCAGLLDAVVIGVGTGGTFTGVVRALRRHRPDLPAYAVESQGSVLGGGAPGPTRVEGIGSRFLPAPLDRSLVTAFLTVRDEDAFATARALAREDGLLAGPSGGAIVFGALEIARRLGPRRRVATLVPDAAERYCSQGLLGD
jgi:cysteine synthase